MASCSAPAPPWQAVCPSQRPKGTIVRCETGKAKTNVLGLTPDGKHVVLHARDDTTWVCEAAAGTEVLRIGQSFPLLSPKGKLVSRWGREVTLWDLASAHEKRVFEWRTRAYVAGVALSPDERLLAVSTDGGVTLWDTGWGAPVGRLAAGPAYSLGFSPDGSLLACAYQREAALLRVGDGQVLRHIRLGEGLGGQVTLLGFSASGKSLAVGEWHQVPLPPGTRLARPDSMIRMGGSTLVYAVATGELVLRAEQGAVLSADQTTLIAPQREKESRVLLYEPDTGRLIASLQAGWPAVTDGGLMAAFGRLEHVEGGRPRQVFGFWEVRTGKKLGEVALEDRSWSCLALSTEARLLVLTGGSGLELCVVDRLSGQKAIELSAPPQHGWPPSWHVAFSADGRKLAFSAYGSAGVVDLELLRR